MSAAADSLRIVVLGSGTSVGIPMVGCGCAVCLSTDSRDKRLRPSVLLQYGGKNVVIDTTPDFRSQALRAGIDHLDAVLFTHAHADHIMGLDDVRPFNIGRQEAIPIHGSLETLAVIERCFSYILNNDEAESWVPRLELHSFGDAPFALCGMTVTPVPVMHGRQRIYGFRFGNAAYITDQSDIPPESLEKLRGLDVLFLDALRHKSHPTHSTVARALQWVEELAPSRAYFTHICHSLAHEETQSALPPGVYLAYDALEINLPEER